MRVNKGKKINIYQLKNMRWPGIEPGSTAWKAAMLTIIPPTLVIQWAKCKVEKNIFVFKKNELFSSQQWLLSNNY